MVMYPKAKAVVERAGIDPSTVLVDGVTPFGYERIMTDNSGRRVYDHLGLVSRHLPWPNALVGWSVWLTMKREGWRR